MAQHNLYVNYLRLTAPVELLHGDRICFGELLLHVDLKTPPPAKAQQSERRIVLAMTESSEADTDSEGPREVFLKGESTRLGTTPQSEVDWPTSDELLIDMTVLWHPNGTPLLHVGMWSAEVTLDGHKLRRCTLAPLRVGSTIEAAGTTALVRELVPSPLPKLTP